MADEMKVDPFSQMNSMLINESHSQCYKFLKVGPMKSTKLEWSHPIRRDITNGPQWQMKWKVGPFHK